MSFLIEAAGGRLEGAGLLGVGFAVVELFADEGALAVELDPESAAVPLPGVIGPSTPDSGGSAWGAGASGTGVCSV
jgi:hypothetical protein